MRKISIFILFMFLIFVNQTLNAQKFSLQSGYNAAFFKGNWNDREIKSNKIKNGYQIGPIVELSFSRSVIFKSGILLSLKGARNYRRSNEDFLIEDNTRYNLYYLELPVVIRKEFRIAEFPLFVEAGGYAAHGIYGYAITEGVNDTKIVKEFDRAFFVKKLQDWPSFTSMDYGLIGGLGREFNNLTIGINYSMGIRDIDHKNDLTLQNNVFSFYLSYVLFQTNEK